MKNFVSVSTGAARYQEISLNPQKLAGMCAKLKCCLNYEVDNYIEASRRLPSREVVLETQDGEYYLFKSDILAGLVTYSSDKKVPANLETITAKRALDIIDMNRRGEKPMSLQSDGNIKEQSSHPADLLANESLTRLTRARRSAVQRTARHARLQQKDAARLRPRKDSRSLMEPKSKRRQTSNDEIKITYSYSRGLCGHGFVLM